MKLSKSTTVLINVALVLLIALLVKSFVTAPPNVNAATNKEYSVQLVSKSPIKARGSMAFAESLSSTLKSQAKQGWKFLFAFDDAYGYFHLIFER
jgi:hypothetical protein